MNNDARFLERAIELGEGQQGIVAPNPAVGCALVKDNEIIGEGATQKGGRPHAETVALEQAGEKARGATAYVSLEPCAHHGKTGPCALALVKAGVARVVVAVRDPNPKVNGGGIKILQDAGIDVVLAQDVPELKELALRAAQGHAGFFRSIGFDIFGKPVPRRPLVTIKVATDPEGSMAAAPMTRTQISGAQAMEYTHKMRATHDAILVGINTALADDPLLICRLPEGEDRSPIRIVLDADLMLPRTGKLALTAKDYPLWIVAGRNADHAARDALEKMGAQIIEMPCKADGLFDPLELTRMLAEKEITRLMVEGGGQVINSFVDAGVVDSLHWVTSPKKLEGHGQKLHKNTLIQGFRPVSSRNLGEDRLEIFACLG